MNGCHQRDAPIVVAIPFVSLLLVKCGDSSVLHLRRESFLTPAQTEQAVEVSFQRGFALQEVGGYAIRARRSSRCCASHGVSDNDIKAMGRHCTSRGEHQSKPPKPAVHPWMLPEKPWSRLHIDHAINFLG